jgi:hypothetical protein
MPKPNRLLGPTEFCCLLVALFAILAAVVFVREPQAKLLIPFTLVFVQGLAAIVVFRRLIKHDFARDKVDA